MTLVLCFIYQSLDEMTSPVGHDARISGWGITTRCGDQPTAFRQGEWLSDHREPPIEGLNRPAALGQYQPLSIRLVERLESARSGHSLLIDDVFFHPLDEIRIE